MIDRTLEKKLIKSAKGFPAIAIMGPRQSGKTTLAKKTFHLPYFTLEDLGTREYAEQDPKGFLESLKEGAILDEVQRVPNLFSYLQGILDNSKKRGWFILTGSEHFLLHEKISQSLAGRVSYKNLLPFSLEELINSNLKTPKTPEEWILKGFYPPVHAEKVDTREWLQAYTNSYLERDVRMLKNVHNLSTFQTFLQICAGRVGQLVNASSIAVELGVSPNTVKTWLSILETGFIIFLLRPHHKNFRKRLVKMPKLYFWDTGLASMLMNIRDVEQLNQHPMKGALFENLIIADLAKQAWNRGETPSLYFWRDNTGHEIDLLWDKGQTLLPIEIKSGKTIREDWAEQLNYWCKLSGTTNKGTVLHAGDETQNRPSANFTSWKNWSTFFEDNNH